MKLEDGDLVLSKAELDRELTALGVEPSLLGFRPSGSKAEAPPAEEADPALRDDLRTALLALVRPRQVARMTHTFAEESVSRAFLAWPGLDGGPHDSVVVLNMAGEDRRVSLRTEEEVRRIAAGVVAADESLRAANLGLALSTSALVTLLAIADHARMQRHVSAISHVTPSLAFGIPDLEARVADSGNEDFRFPLLFAASLLPFEVAGNVTTEDLELGVEELLTAGLLAPMDETGEARVFEPARAGEDLLLGLVHEAAKLGIAFAVERTDGEAGHEVLLFVRAPTALYLFDFDGKGGALASVSTGGFDELLRTAFRPARAPVPSARPVPDAPPPPPEPKPTPARFCMECGTELNPGQKFCMECGAKAG